MSAGDPVGPRTSIAFLGVAGELLLSDRDSR
jgi:hypothetical protein